MASLLLVGDSCLYLGTGNRLIMSEEQLGGDARLTPLNIPVVQQFTVRVQDGNFGFAAGCCLWLRNVGSVVSHFQLVRTPATGSPSGRSGFCFSILMIDEG